MERAKKLYLVRHGQTEWNVERRMQGQHDSPLTTLGKRQAKTSGQFLASLGVDKFYASPLGRVQQTLDIIKNEIDAPVTIDDRLSEWNSGEWSSHLYSDLDWRWPELFPRWDADRFNVRPPSGENYPDMMSRVRSILDEIRNDPSERIAIISHGMLARAMMGVLLDLQPEDILRIRQRNDVIVRIARGKTVAADHFVGGNGPRKFLPFEH